MNRKDVVKLLGVPEDDFPPNGDWGGSVKYDLVDAPAGCPP
jgi:hypothetical protein